MTGKGRVLVYRALGLGDFLTAVPAYRAVSRAFPAYQVCLAAPAPLRPLARLCTEIDSFLPTPELAAPPWSGPPPAVAVNLHGKGPASHRLLQAMGPGRLVAFACAEAGTDGPRWRPGEHEVHRWCRLLGESGIAADPTELDLDAGDAEAPVPGAVVVHPGAASTSRRWPVDRFAAVARRLERDVGPVVVTGTAVESVLAEELVATAGLPAGRSLAGQLDLGRLAAQVGRSRLVVCGDTGVGHLATALRTPSVLLFGPVPPAEWGPPAQRCEHVVLWAEAGTDGGRERSPVDPRLLSLTVEDVLRAVDRLQLAQAAESC